jgi:hypothetical protein
MLRSNLLLWISLALIAPGLCVLAYWFVIDAWENPFSFSNLRNYFILLMIGLGIRRCCKWPSAARKKPNP